MKRNEDALFMELLEKRECTYRLEEANTAARIVQALAEDKHVKKLSVDAVHAGGRHRG